MEYFEYVSSGKSLFNINEDDEEKGSEGMREGERAEKVSEEKKRKEEIERERTTNKTFN